MFKVDLIIPSLISYQKYPKCKDYHKLLKFQEIAFPSWSGNWFPIWLNLSNFEKIGLKIRFFNFTNIKHKKLSNIIGIDSRIINNLIFKYKSVNTTIKEEIIPLIKKLRKNVDTIMYFDNSDSTGHFHHELFPYVDKYFKKQLLEDYDLYKKDLYGKRLYTDFYARNYSIAEDMGTKSGFNITPEIKNKLALSWNFAFKDYRYSNLLNRFLYGLNRKNNLKIYDPKNKRKILLSANYTIKKNYNLIYFQRNELLNLLKVKYKSNSNVSIGRIPKKIYLKTLRSSRTIVSPYGWGEICYRDFEAFISGAALIKPNMDHLKTWPNIYREGETYLSLPWKIENWNNSFDEILDDHETLLKVAIEGQNSFKKLYTHEGRRDFCQHFINMITN